MTILVTGPKGFVGQNLMAYYPDAIGAPSLRNATEEQVRRLIGETEPDVIIHTAAMSDVEDCERDPEGSYIANVTLPLLLAKNRMGAKFIAFSSDQVYTGCDSFGPYVEEDACPGNTYAREKMEMEQRILDLVPESVMLRAEWMYHHTAPKGNFFLNNRNAVGTVFASKGEYRSVTYIREVCENMDAVIKMPGGAYNFGSETNLSFYGLTGAFLDFLGKDNPLGDCPGRHNIWVNCQKARNYGVVFSDAVDALKKCYSDSLNT